MQVLEVEGHFLLADFGGEEVEAEDLVPDEVVLLAPGAGAVEGEAVVVAVARPRCPAVRPSSVRQSCDTRSATSALPIAAAICGVGAEADDGLDREVGVVGQVAGEVVGAELVLGIEALARQVVGPLGQNCGQYSLAKSALPSPCHGGDEDEQVAAFLDRHLVVLGALAAAVDLAVGEWVGAEVVRGEGPLPARQGGVVEDRLELGLEQVGLEEEEERRRRIE